ncbi:MAG: hypothetical protein P8Y44_13945, partial [Acidobacteriota bacterium]
MLRLRLIAAASIVSIGLPALGCRHETLSQEPISQSTVQLAASLQDLIDTAVADQESIHGAALYVATPRLGLEFEGAAGLA